MSLEDIYPALRSAIFAFIPKYLPREDKRKLPPVLGTGFFIGEEGLALTNAHVAESFNQLYIPEDKTENKWPVQALLFVKYRERLIALKIDVLAVIKEGSISSEGRKRLKKDLAFVQLDISGVPFIEIDEDFELKEGMQLACSGFSSGRRALESPAGLQLGPSLQRGILSAILPYPKKKARVFALNIMAHGGASGSPVFHTKSGKLLGILFSSLYDAGLSDKKEDPYLVPTNISYALSSYAIRESLERLPYYSFQGPDMLSLLEREYQRSEEVF